MKKVLTIRVKCEEPYAVQGKNCKVCMVPFTGEATGELFNGHIIGTGVDTQKYREGQPGQLSARYMLEGTDCTGTACRIFIENSLHDEAGWHPKIVTDSEALSYLEEADLIATVDGIEDGVLVQVYDGNGEKETEGRSFSFHCLA